MTKRFQNIIKKSQSVWILAVGIVLWQAVVSLGVVERFMLPSPIDVIKAFITDFYLLTSHCKTTLCEAFIGLLLSVLFGFLIALCMDRFHFVHKGLYPILIISQTIPSIAIAPLLVLWQGYGMAPKITLIFIVCFFPITIGLLDGFKSHDKDYARLLKSMGAKRMQIFWHVKLPFALPHFLSGLKIAVSYSIVGAVISEWLGGTSGLGVYMTRVRKAYCFDKMFAVIFLISIISLVLIWLVNLLIKKCNVTIYKKDD
ncbi:MAG: ABC transporter permease [Oscillospiraceae bacterium]|nr:ABC transporter permease [Oscillospiraceae bacterium]